MSDPAYMTMREIARYFESTTSHKIGRILKALGLRTHDGMPSRRAHELGLVSKRPVYWNERYEVTTWHGEKTMRLLEKAGLKLKRLDHRHVVQVSDVVMGRR